MQIIYYPSLIINLSFVSMWVFYQRQAQPDGAEAEVKESADGDQQQVEGEKVSSRMRAFVGVLR